MAHIADGLYGLRVYNNNLILCFFTFLSVIASFLLNYYHLWQLKPVVICFKWKQTNRLKIMHTVLSLLNRQSHWHRCWVYFSFIAIICQQYVISSALTSAQMSSSLLTVGDRQETGMPNGNKKQISLNKSMCDAINELNSMIPAYGPHPHLLVRRLSFISLKVITIYICNSLDHRRLLHTQPQATGTP